MSDITKKIFSIEPDDVKAALQSEPSADEILRPLDARPPMPNAGASPEPKLRPTPEDVPEFVTREPIEKRSTIPVADAQPVDSGSGWIGWTALGLATLWVIGASLFFGAPLLRGESGFLQLAGLVLLLALPVMLIAILWIALTQFIRLADQNIRITGAASALVSPDREALMRTQSLASGIRAEITKVNRQLSDTVEALKGVQIAVTQESEALETAGLQLTSRSEDVGQNLTQQRLALESISNAFDARIERLSSQVLKTTQSLDAVCIDADQRLSLVSTKLEDTGKSLETRLTSSTEILGTSVSELSVINEALGDASGQLVTQIQNSTLHLDQLERGITDHSKSLDTINQTAHDKVVALKATLVAGQDMLAELNAALSFRNAEISSFYDGLGDQLRQSEDDMLAAQGQTARMVEANLAQMRRDFGRMETELAALQSRLSNLREGAEAIDEPAEPTLSRLNLKPLDSDFPPVEPPETVRAPLITSAPEKSDNAEDIDLTPLDLGADMELDDPQKAADKALTEFEPDIVKRPGEDPKPGKGFGKRLSKTEKEEADWRWRDMLGTLERPDEDVVIRADETKAPTASPVTPAALPVDMVARLKDLQLSPSAIVDEGTVIDATQARIKKGEDGLADAVRKNLPDAVNHLRTLIMKDMGLKKDTEAFTANFATSVGLTPPSAPSLRAAYSSNKGRAYLLCAAALA